MRIGQGFDAHRFCDGSVVVIGGVSIPHSQGLLAHSDGDVLLHALCDALLGAAGLGDIGKHFPDTSEQFKGIDSRELLRSVIKLLDDKGYQLINADMTVIAQAPKMAPHIIAMCENIAMDSLVETDAINVKATTTEQMGFTGRSEGIAAMANVLISQR
jgi:2-C-methyl-D-erythritol 2,4-cyclodiphosphate synthase